MQEDKLTLHVHCLSPLLAVRGRSYAKFHTLQSAPSRQMPWLPSDAVQTPCMGSACCAS